MRNLESRNKKQIFRANSLLSYVPMTDNHIHTKFTDGSLTLTEIVDEALAKGISSITITEHTSLGSSTWFNNLVEDIDGYKNQIEISLGTEVRICDYLGGIAIDPKVQEISELIVASVHRFPGNDGQKIEFEDALLLDTQEIELQLMLGAIRSHSCDVIGHPFGMSLVRYNRIPSRDQIEILVDEAITNGVALEINSKYHHGEFFDCYLEMLVLRDALISIGSDVHNSGELGECSNRIWRSLNVKED